MLQEHTAAKRQCATATSRLLCMLCKQAGGSIAGKPAFLGSAVRTETHRCKTASHRACSCRCWECGEVEVEKQSNHHPPIQYSSSLPRQFFGRRSQSRRVRCCNQPPPPPPDCCLPHGRMGCMLHVGFVAALKSRFATRSSAIDPSRPKRDIDSSRARRWTGAREGREKRERHMLYPAFLILMRAVAPPPPSVHASGKTRLYSGKHALTHRTRAWPRTA